MSQDRYGETSPQALEVVERLAEVLDSSYRFAEAQRFAARLDTGRGAIADRRRLANLYRKRSIPGRAVEILEGALELSIAEHGADAKPTLEIMRDMSEAYSLLSDFARSAELAQEALGRSQAELGESAHLTRRLQVGVGSLEKSRKYRAAREVEARRRFEQAAERDGLEAAQSGAAMEAWVSSLIYLQDLENSTRELANYLRRVREEFGAESLESLEARGLEAWHAKRFGQGERADQLFGDLIADERRLLGNNHSLTRKSIYSYSDFLIRRGRFADFDRLVDDWQDDLKGASWETSEIILPRREPWLFLNHERDEGTAWREFGKEAIVLPTGSRWLRGVAPFGYGIVGIGTSPLQVAGRYDHTTFYFRRSFEVTDPARFDALKLRLLREGGAAVYVNGEEVLRTNLAPDAAFDSLAEDGSRYSRSNYYVFLVDPSCLREGENIVAVEVHQEELNSPDMAFDLEISGRVNLEESEILE